MVAASVGARIEEPPPGPVVWLVDADHWPRASLRAELIERGYDAIGFARIDDALLRLATSRERRPRLVVVNLAGQDLTRGAVALLGAGGVPVLGLGTAAHPGGDLGLTAVLRRPVSLGQIADAVQRALDPRSGGTK